jgi:hypothetical protein
MKGACYALKMACLGLKGLLVVKIYIVVFQVLDTSKSCRLMRIRDILCLSAAYCSLFPLCWYHPT